MLFLGRFINGVPKAWAEKPVRAWLDAGGKLRGDQADLIFGKVAFTAKGDLVLDAANRLAGDLSVDVTGHGALLDMVAKSGRIPKDQLPFIKTAMNLMAAENGGKITLPLRLADGVAWFGPMQLGTLSPLL